MTTYYFAGGSYEVRNDGTTTTTIKYYAFAGQTIAMDDGSGLKYFLTDHLGSIVAVTNASGTLVSQQRYLPFGEVRTDVDTITETDFGYTGQRDVPNLGLMDYRARFYDSYITHFTQPDSIVPDPYNPQALNRYAYVLNNPLKYTDPSGHSICWEDGYCVKAGDKNSDANHLSYLSKQYGISFDGLDLNHEWAVAWAVEAVGDQLAERRDIGETSAAAFKAVYKGGVNFKWETTDGTCGEDTVNSGGCTDSPNQIGFWSMSGDSNSKSLDMSRMVKNVVHELGHAYYDSIKNPVLGYGFSRDALIPNPSYDTGEVLDWQQHPGADGPELFADTFIAWTYGAWNSVNVRAVTFAQNAMNSFVPRP